MENLKKFTLHLIAILAPGVEDLDRRFNSHSQENEWWNFSFKCTFDRVFNAVEKAHLSAIKRHADTRTKLLMLLEGDPNCDQPATFKAAAAVEVAKVIDDIAEALATAFDNAHIEFTGATFDVDEYAARWSDPKTNKKTTKATKDRIHALVANLKTDKLRAELIEDHNNTGAI
jgi:hypothetical protein